MSLRTLSGHEIAASEIVPGDGREDDPGEDSSGEAEDPSDHPQNLQLNRLGDEAGDAAKHRDSLLKAHKCDRVGNGPGDDGDPGDGDGDDDDEKDDEETDTIMKKVLKTLCTLMKSSTYISCNGTEKDERRVDI